MMADDGTDRECLRPRYRRREIGKVATASKRVNCLGARVYCCASRRRLLGRELGEARRVHTKA